MSKALLFLIALSLLSAPCLAGDTNGLIVLLTDYGIEDEYVGVIKGVIYTVYPSAQIDSITNSIPKCDVKTGAYILRDASREYPSGTLFLAVVDPGVGTGRKAIAIKTKDNKYFVGPDNGLLSLAVKEAGIETIREISNRDLIRSGKLSHTFHGRDIFSPAAAHLAAGLEIGKLGPELKKIAELETKSPSVKDRRITGSVVRIDHFGNAITNIPCEMAEQIGAKAGDLLSIEIGGRKIEIPFVETYANVPPAEPLCLAGASGRLELAVNRGDFAKNYAVMKGMKFTIQKPAPTPQHGK